MKKLLLLAAVFPLLLPGGQSIIVGTQSIVNSTLPIFTTNRVELYLDSWDPTATGGHVLTSGATGWVMTYVISNGVQNIFVCNQWDGCGVVGQIPIATLPQHGVYIRAQYDYANKAEYVQAWDVMGNLITSVSGNFTSTHPAGNDVTLDWGHESVRSYAFVRLYTSILPLNARPPVTADTSSNLVLQWKFDGNLSDASGNGYTANISPGTAVYAPTNYQNYVVAQIRTPNAPSWANTVSQRAGEPASLDGTASYSQADSSASVSCFWQIPSGPSMPVFDSRMSCTPTMSGLVFGDYLVQLTVTDASNQTATVSTDIGAIATDSNSVVINADPNVDRIFGPMIAFGQNPWGYADHQALDATNLRLAAYNAQGLNPPSWEAPQAGTVSYTYSGANGPQVTTLAAAITSGSATTVSVTAADKIDLTNLPTHVLIGPAYGQKEDIRICAASATSGPATLTVCYDGRGQANPAGETYRVSAQAWPSGTQVWQMRVKGTATNFYTAICQGGQGPPGPVLYTTGQVTLTPGSPAVTGIGTAWSNSIGIYTNTTILRVAATHGGVGFVFYAYVTSLTDATDLVLSRPFPPDADGGTYSYSMIQADNRFVTLHYTRTADDDSDAQFFYYTEGCESATDMYVYMGRDLNRVNPGSQTSKQYSYMDGLAYASAFGPNFYGEDLAHRALYYRSGLTVALTAARAMGDYFVRSPVLAGGDGGGIPLLIGGGSLGGFASAVLDTNHAGATRWSDLRGLALLGANMTASACNAFDTRDTGYQESWLIQAANFDPVASYQAGWQTALASMLARDTNCKGIDNSWSNAYLWYPTYGPLNVTLGSAVATGSNLPQAMCYGVASGTATATNGSGALAGSGFVAGNKIVLNGTLNGAPYTAFFRFQMNSGTSITLAALWPGDSGTVTWMVENNDNKSAIGNSNSDPMLSKNWACIWNNATQVTLDRPWTGPTESNAYLYQYLLAGFGQQPYMLGIKTAAMNYASQNSNPSIAVPFGALANQAATWIQTTGYDPVSQGLHYGRVFQVCEPETTPTPGTDFDSRSPECDYGLDADAIRASRVLTAEAGRALSVYYVANPSPAAKAWGDVAYGSIWGNPAYTSGGVYSDPYYVIAENSDASLAAYKWTGFFFGMGMAHQWPAVRLGGVAQPDSRTVYLPFNLSGIPNATEARFTVTEPSGLVSPVVCTVSPCQVTLDGRQGSPLVKLDYMNSSGQVVAPGDVVPMLVP